jgi:hypothetical protein
MNGLRRFLNVLTYIQIVGFGLLLGCGISFMVVVQLFGGSYFNDAVLIILGGITGMLIGLWKAESVRKNTPVDGYYSSELFKPAYQKRNVQRKE